MYLLGYDGGLTTKEDALEAERIIIQRTFLFDVTRQGIPLVLLQPAVFKDSKVSRFVSAQPLCSCEGSPVASPSLDLDLPLLTCCGCFPSRLSRTRCRRVSKRTQGCDARTLDRGGTSRFVELGRHPRVGRRNVCMSHTFLYLSSLSLADSFASQATLPAASESTLLFLFVAHALLLPSIPLSARAQQITTPSENLTKTLESFLSAIFSSLSSIIATLPSTDGLAAFDIDGRLFYLLVSQVLTAESELDLAALLGADVFARATALTSSVGAPSLASFRSAFPSESNELVPLPATVAEPTLLPFSNSTFDKHLSSVHVSTAETETSATLANALVENDRDTRFDDASYWENPRPVLPTHLGGAAPVALDARARKKRDRKEQRFST